MSIKVKVGDIFIGGGAPVSVQTMSVIRPKEVKKAVAEARALKSLGCDILRYAVLDEEDARSFSAIKKEVGLPLVADIHYDYKLALFSIDGGADKIRINPGNIGGEKNVRFVAEALKERGIPVRVGANAGSLKKEFEEKYGRTEVALAESALGATRRPIGKDGGYGFGGECPERLDACALALWAARTTKRDPRRRGRIG